MPSPSGRRDDVCGGIASYPFHSIRRSVNPAQARLLRLPARGIRRRPQQHLGEEFGQVDRFRVGAGLDKGEQLFGVEFSGAGRRP